MPAIGFEPHPASDLATPGGGTVDSSCNTAKIANTHQATLDHLAIRAIIETLGMQIASPSDARAMLATQAGDQFAF
jgi:hypothetical protein